MRRSNVSVSGWASWQFGATATVAVLARTVRAPVDGHSGRRSAAPSSTVNSLLRCGLGFGGLDEFLRQAEQLWALRVASWMRLCLYLSRESVARLLAFLLQRKSEGPWGSLSTLRWWTCEVRVAAQYSSQNFRVLQFSC